MPEVAPGQSAPGQVNDYNTYDFDFHYQARYNFGSSYFSFDSGPAHRVCLNMYTDPLKRSKQYRWLNSIKKTSNWSAGLWNMVHAHGPW